MGLLKYINMSCLNVKYVLIGQTQMRTGLKALGKYVIPCLRSNNSNPFFLQFMVWFLLHRQQTLNLKPLEVFEVYPDGFIIF